MGMYAAIDPSAPQALCLSARAAAAADAFLPAPRRATRFLLRTGTFGGGTMFVTAPVDDRTASAFELACRQWGVAVVRTDEEGGFELLAGAGHATQEEEAEADGMARLLCIGPGRVGCAGKVKVWLAS
jgi:hypothetical protein